MRKDVKLGLAVGGVLLAVLVVYALVVPGTNSNPQGANVTIDGATDAYANNERSGDAASGAESSAAGKNGSADGSIASQGGAMRDQQAPKNGTSADASRDNGATAGSAGGTGSAENVPGETAGGGWNWDALVSGAEKVPSLGASTEIRSNGATLGATSNNGLSGVNGITPQGASGANGTPTPGGGVGGARQVPSNKPVAAPSAGSSETSTPRQNVLSGATAEVAGADPPYTTRVEAGAVAGAKTHVVKVGETFSKISEAVYGSAKHYVQIEQANPNVDPTRLKPGMTINLPTIEAVKPSAGAAAPGATAQQEQKPLDPRTEYKVQPNDSLYTISLRLYGKSDRVEKIYELNKATIGDDMARLKVGAVLKLPDAPSQSATPAQDAAVTAR